MKETTGDISFYKIYEDQNLFGFDNIMDKFISNIRNGENNALIYNNKYGTVNESIVFARYDNQYCFLLIEKEDKNKKILLEVKDANTDETLNTYFVYKTFVLVDKNSKMVALLGNKEVLSHFERYLITSSGFADKKDFSFNILTVSPEGIKKIIENAKSITKWVYKLDKDEVKQFFPVEELNMIDSGFKKGFVSINFDIKEISQKKALSKIRKGHLTLTDEDGRSSVIDVLENTFSRKISIKLDDNMIADMSQVEETMLNNLKSIINDK